MGRKVVWNKPETVGPHIPAQVSLDTCPDWPGVYYFPNRPTLVPPDPKNPTNPSPSYITSLESTGRYLAEQKWNGDNTYIYTDTLKFWNRRKELLKFQPTPEMLTEISKWPKGCVINAELVQNRTKTIKGLLIVHAVMVYKGKALLGKTWGDSRRIIEDLPYGDHCKLSKTYQSGFWKLFMEADGTVIEGIILKDPRGRLVFSTNVIKDVPWMLKIRKPCKKYQF